MKLYLIRKHYSGNVKIHDRKPELDENGKATGDFFPVVHFLKADAYNKPFTVNDPEYVLSLHGSIVSKNPIEDSK